VFPCEKNKHHTTLGCFSNLHSSFLPRPSRCFTSTKYFYSPFEQRDLATYLSDKLLTSLPVLVEKGKKLDRKSPNLQVLISLHFTPESSNVMKLNNRLQQLGLQLVSLILVWKTNQNSPAIRLFCTWVCYRFANTRERSLTVGKNLQQVLLKPYNHDLSKVEPAVLML
jgi:hypothetical protein